MRNPLHVLRLDSLGPECVRYDLARFSPKTTRTPQGFLKAPAAFTRAGVLTYTRADGTEVKELRPEKEVFDEASLATLRGAPMTLGHPAEGMVTPKNATKLTIGWGSEEVERKDMIAAGTVTVMDGGAISGLSSGDLKDISMGYRCRVDATPGVHPIFGRYDQIQREIRYNHIALGGVDWGRAGGDVGIRLDDSGAVQRLDVRSNLELLVDQQMELQGLDRVDLAKKAGLDLFVLEDLLWGWGVPKRSDLAKVAKALDIEVETLVSLVPRVDRADDKGKRSTMETEKIVIGGVEFEVAKPAAQAMRNAITRHDSEKAELQREHDELKARFDTQAEELKSSKTKLDEANDPKRLDSKINARIDLVAKARKVLGDEAKIEGTDREIMSQVLRHDGEDRIPEGSSDDFVSARFDSFLEYFVKEPPKGNRGAVRKDAISASTHSTGSKADEARKAMLEANAKAAYGPLATTRQS